MSERSVSKEAVASTPQERSLRQEEELLLKYQEASVAFFLLAEADRPERLEQVGRLMDRLAAELRS